MEIPFLDGPEGACTETVSHKGTLIDAKKWAEMRPFMLMIHVKSWTDIKKDWQSNCRLAGPDCNVQLQSVDTAIQELDKTLKRVFPGISQ